MKKETGDKGRRYIIVWSMKEFGLYTKVNGKPAGKRRDLILLLEKIASGAVEYRLEGLEGGNQLRGCANLGRKEGLN